MKEIYEDAINYLKYYGEFNNEKIENIAYFLDCELKNYIKLQSNWNSLREWLEEQNKFYEVSTMGYSYGVICNVLDKMNELEGKNNNGISNN